MMWKRDRYTPKRLIDMPTVVVSISWLAIWLLWLTVDDAYMYSENVPLCKISFVDVNVGDMNSYKNPAFAFPSLLSNIGDDKIDIKKIVEESRVVDRSKLLEQPEKPAGKQGNAAAVRHLGRAKLEMRGYHAKWPKADKPDQPIYGRVNPIHIEPSAGLERYGYYIPADAIENVMESNSSWEVTAHVELNKEGLTEHVFLLSSSADKSISSKVERMLSQGVLYTTGRENSGKVVVSSRGNK